jgi:1-acyl-sn-glycerol-3-phosphate acyltransferase
MMPPTVLRRPLTVTAWLLLSTLCLILSPLLLAGAAVSALIMRRPQPLLLTRLLIAYFARELGVLVACGGLWLASGAGLFMRHPRFQALHYRLLRWFVHGLAGRVRSLLALDVAARPDPDALEALERDRPLLYFSRHAGPGDTVLLIDLLFDHYRRLPSVVFKETLEIDPCIDLLAHRLPQAALDTSDADKCEAQIREVTSRLGRRGMLVLFPEGGNFTPERRRKAIASLWRKGHDRQAVAAEKMSHVMPPHPHGALAALAANPDADVIFSAHTGLGLAAFPRELWRNTPIGKTLEVRMWLAPARERPAGRDEQADWLFGWWKRLDEWVAGQGQEGPGATPAPRRD